ncbi:energy transducer TonB [Rufibacter soli]
MKSKPTITLAFACPQDWNSMSDCAGGRFCPTCQKTVFDLTQKNEFEIRQLQKQQGQICGLFYTNNVVVSASSFNCDYWLRRVMASVFLGLGLTTLSGPVQAQSNPKKTEMEERLSSNFTLGVVMEVMPEYKYGGQKGLQKFLQQNIRNPEKIDGRLVVSFVIDTTGKPADIQILKGLSKNADQEAKRVVNLLEFKPGMQAGRKVPVQYTLPIQFGEITPFKEKL